MDEAFFIASKTMGQLVRVESWLLIFLALGLLAGLRGRNRAAMGWTGLVFALVLALTLFPLGTVLLRPLETTYPANPPVERVDAIIVLGGGEDLRPHVLAGQAGFNDAGERQVIGAELALRHPGARLVFTGGTARLGSNPRHALPSQMTRDFWLSMGIAADRILLEDLSRTTSENAAFTRDLLNPQPGEVILLVTSAWHMPRAMETFERAGWTGLVAWPVDFRRQGSAFWPHWKLDEHLKEVNLAIKEHVGLWAYRWAGK